MHVWVHIQPPQLALSFAASAKINSTNLNINYTTFTQKKNERQFTSFYISFQVKILWAKVHFFKLETIVALVCSRLRFIILYLIPVFLFLVCACTFGNVDCMWHGSAALQYKASKNAYEFECYYYVCDLNQNDSEKKDAFPFKSHQFR